MDLYGPMGVLAGLTGLVLTQVPIRRYLAVRGGAVRIGDFSLGEAPTPPAAMALVNRNYMNLLEAPLLFYIVCLMYQAAGRVSETTVQLAWMYVGLRVVHAAIHLTYNNVIHRALAFAFSNFVLTALWVLFYLPG